ncbi:MAG: hypothetical protein E7616_03835 [Ruminococcaceae bacterium]|nr:hypothetical protein [Oscillospiraceae bacterium]
MPQLSILLIITSCNIENTHCKKHNAAAQHKSQNKHQHVHHPAFRQTLISAQHNYSYVVFYMFTYICVQILHLIIAYFLIVLQEVWKKKQQKLNLCIAKKPF